MKKIFIALIKAYRYFISPLLGGNCRYEPTCSQYMIEAVERFGVVKGFYLGIKRLSGCHPFKFGRKKKEQQAFQGFYDPVPEHFSCKPDKIKTNDKTQNDKKGILQDNDDKQ